jgi:hypothetical protein
MVGCEINIQGGRVNLSPSGLDFQTILKVKLLLERQSVGDEVGAHGVV